MAIRLDSLRNGAKLANAFGVGFIDWLDAFMRRTLVLQLQGMKQLRQLACDAGDAVEKKKNEKH